MTDGRALTWEQANAVWDILVEHAGATEDGRLDFVAAQTRGACDEYRFIGGLMFGGKFWTSTDGGGRWYVTAYPEDVARWPWIQQAIDVTNAALDGLRASYVALSAALGKEDR